MPQFPQDRQTVAVGQSKIEDHRRVGRGHQRGAGLGGGGEQVGLVASRPQPLGEQFGQQRIVFDNQQSHGWPIADGSEFS